MVALYSRPFVKDEDWLHVGGYYTLFGLLTVGLSGMIITGDVFNLYVYLEIMSLSGYGLIALGGRKSMLAAFRYLLIGTIGASLYLLGVGYLYPVMPGFAAGLQHSLQYDAGIGKGTCDRSHNYPGA